MFSFFFFCSRQSVQEHTDFDGEGNKLIREAMRNMTHTHCTVLCIVLQGTNLLLSPSKPVGPYMATELSRQEKRVFLTPALRHFKITAIVSGDPAAGICLYASRPYLFWFTLWQLPLLHEKTTKPEKS